MTEDNKTTDLKQGRTGGSMLPPEADAKLKHDASALADTAREELSHLKDEAVTQASALAEEGQHQVEKAVEKAKGIATEQKDLLVDQLSGVSSAVGKVASELENDGAPAAGYARTLADSVEKFTTTLREKDVDGILSMAQDFGRKQPAALMAAAAIAGFAASRFLVASSQRRETAAQPTQNTGSSTYSGVEAGSSGNAGTSSQVRDSMGGGI